MTITQDAFYFTSNHLGPHCTGTPCPPLDTSDIVWHRLDTCSNFFTCGPPSTSADNRMVRVVGKRVVGILLEWFLVCNQVAGWKLNVSHNVTVQNRQRLEI